MQNLGHLLIHGTAQGHGFFWLSSGSHSSDWDYHCFLGSSLLFCFPDRCCLYFKYLKKQCKSALEKWHTGEPEVRHLALWEGLLAWAYASYSPSKFRGHTGRAYVCLQRAFHSSTYFQLHSVFLKLMVLLAWIQIGAQSYWCFLVSRCSGELATISMCTPSC